MKTIKIGDDPSVYATGNDNCKTSTTGTSDQKPKELDWEKEFDKKFGDEYMDYDYGIKFSQITLSKNIKDFISKTLQQQREDYEFTRKEIIEWLHEQNWKCEQLEKLLIQPKK